MFPTANNSSYVATGQQQQPQQQNHQQQLSPNRVQMSIGGGSGNNIVGPPMSTRSNSMFGGSGQQRAFADRRAMSGLGGGPMVSRFSNPPLISSIKFNLFLAVQHKKFHAI
jgi:hypothetical protein